MFVSIQNDYLLYILLTLLCYVAWDLISLPHSNMLIADCWLLVAGCWLLNVRSTSQARTTFLKWVEKLWYATSWPLIAWRWGITEFYRIINTLKSWLKFNHNINHLFDIIRINLFYFWIEYNNIFEWFDLIHSRHSYWSSEIKGVTVPPLLEKFHPPHPHVDPKIENSGGDAPSPFHPCHHLDFQKKITPPHELFWKI